MDIALEEAEAAGARGEVPVGAVIIKNNQIIARAGNETRAKNDPTAHAEMLAIRRASFVLKSPRLLDCDLFVTLEPCAMCAGAIAEARIARLYFGASDEKSGGTFHGAKVFSHQQCHHKPEIYDGIAENRSRLILQQFFSQRRD